MARRRRKTKRKLSKPALIVLIVLGLLIVAGGSVYAYKKWPRDPEKYAARAEAVLETADSMEDLKEAERFLQIAINNAGRQKRTDLQSDLYVRMADLQLELSEQPDLLPAQVEKHIGQARGSLQLATRVNPDNIVAQRRLAETYWELIRLTGGNNGTINEAYRDEATKLLALEPNNPQTYYRRGVAWSHRARRVPGQATENTLGDYDQAISLDPNDSTYWLAKATFLEQIDRPQETDEVYRQAVEATAESEDTNDTIRVAYAAFLRRRDQVDQARRQYETVLQRAPDSVAANLGYAEFSINQRDVDSALQAIERARQADPNNPSVYTSLSVIHQATSDLPKAAEAMRTARDLLEERRRQIPDTRDRFLERRITTLQVAELNYKLAELLLNLVPLNIDDEQRKQALLDESKEILDQLKVLEEGHPYVQKTAGLIAMYEGEAQKAAQLLQSAYDQFASTGRIDTRTGYFLISIYNQTGQPGKADQIIEQLSRIPQAAGQPFLHLQQAYIKLKYRQYEQAAQALDRVIQAIPDHQAALNLRRALGVVLADNASVPEHLEVDDRVATVFLQYAGKLISEGRTDDARNVLEQLHAKAPRNLQVTLQLASFYGDIGQEQEVLRVMEEASRQHPENESLRKQIELMKTTDPAERFEARLALADEEPDPAMRALKKANICRIYRDHDRAKQYLREALKAKPDTAPVLAQLFTYAVQDQNWEQARELADHARQYDMDEAGGKVFRAQLALAQDNTPRAIELLEETVRENDSLKNAWSMLGQCYLTREDGDPLDNLANAERSFRGALNADASYVPAVIGMARIAQRKGDQNMYELRVREAYRLSPTNPEVRSRYLELMEGQEDIAEVIRSREQMYQANPANLQNALRLASLYEKQNRLGDAEKIYQYIYENGRPKVTGAAHLAHFYGRTDRFSRAETIVTDLLRSGEDKVGAYLLYADVFSEANAAQAQGALRNAIKIAPEDPRGYQALARFYAGRREWDAAASAMLKVMEVGEASPLYRKELARLLINAGRPQQATEHLNIVLAESPNDVEALALKGRMLTLTDQLEEAEQLLQRAIAVAPGAAQPHQYMATIHELRGEVDEAASDLRRAWNISGDPQVGAILAALYRQAREPGMAEDVYREILEDNPSHMPSLAGLRQLLMEQQQWQKLEQLLMDVRVRLPRDETNYLWEAEMWAARRQPSRVFGALQAGLQRFPRSLPLQMSVLDNLLSAEQLSRIEPQAKAFVPNIEDMPVSMKLIIAVARARQGQTEQADALFLDAVKTCLPPELPVVVLRMRQAYEVAGALERMEQWKSHRIQEPYYFERMGQLYIQRGQEGDLQRAVEALKQARTLTGDEEFIARLDRSLGSVYYMLGQWPQAEQAWLSALKQMPTDVPLLNNIAYLYAENMDQPAKALPYAEKARQLEPTDHNVLDTHGWVQAQAGRLDSARATLERVVSLDGSNPTYRYHLGWVMEKSGRTERARQEYEQARKLLQQQPDPDMEAAVNQGLERLAQPVE